MKALLLLALMMISITSFATTRRYRLMFNSPDPSTEITIGWEQQSGTNPIVYYDVVDHGTNIGSYNFTHGVDRQVNYQGMDNRFSWLTGLQPNTVYYFVIGDSEGTSQRYWFRTCPDVNTEVISLITGGDSRSGTTQRQNSNRMVAKIRPHAVLFGGDLQNTPSNSVMQQWLDDWQLTITSDNQMIPVVHSFGNHEQYGNGGANLIRDLFDTPYDVYYNVRFGGDLFSMYTLNGEVLPGHTIPNNTVRIAQRNWLNTSLQADGSIWKGAQYHRPIVPHEAGKGEGADEYYDWANLFYEYGVRLVMESDAHVTKMCMEVKPAFLGVPHTSATGNSSNWFVPTTGADDPNKGITFIGEGAWGTIRTPDDLHPFTLAATDIYQFNWLLIDACKIEIRTFDTQSPGTVPEHVAGDYTSVSAGLEAQLWKPTAVPTGVRTIVRCSPPTADFEADQTNIFTGTTVNFTDLSTNSPVSWVWDFGDGSPTSSIQNPSHTYTTPGTYTVSLTATNAEGSDMESKLDYIVVVDPTAPTADFIADMTSASVGQTINFTDLSTGVPASWSWNFGDGVGASTAQNPSYAYSAPGTYTVSLTASNAYGSDDEVKLNYIVIVNGGSVSVFVQEANDDAEEFNDDNSMYLTSSDLEIGNDGGTEQLMGVRFQNVNVPQGAIISNARIRFRADETDVVTSQMNIYIKAEDVDHSLQFNSTDGDISGRTLTSAMYTWPDGSVPGWNAGTYYETPNLSTVIQEVVDRTGWTFGNAMSFVFWSDPGETSERVAYAYEGGSPAELIFDYIIPLPPAPVANFSASANSVCEGSSVNFTDNSTNNPTSWNWTVTGPVNQSSTQQNPSFNFTTPGTYSVELIAANAGGSNTYSQSNLLTINPIPSAPTISASGPSTFCSGGSVSLTSSQGSGNTWSTSATSPSINVTTSGSYAVTYTDANGCQATSAPIVVTVNPLPATPTITAGSSTTFCDGGSVTLTSSQGSGNTWSTSATTSAIDVTTSGSYSVTYTDGNGCQATSTPIVVAVNPLPATPTITAGSSTTFCDGGSVTLTSSQGSGNTWSTAATTPSIDVTSSGSFSVTYTDANGCQATSVPTVVTVNPVPAITLATVVDPNACSTATGSIEIGGSGTGDVSWSGTTTGTANAVSLPYTISNLAAGSYSINFTENACVSNGLNQVLNDPNPPSAPVITANGPTTFCQGASVELSSSYGSNNNWSTSETTASIAVTSSGSYTVSYTDAAGCTATSSPVVVTVNPLPTQPTISANGGTTFCEGSSVELSSSEAAGNSWSTGENTQLITANSTQTITLNVTDPNGCVSPNTSVDIVVNPLPTVSLSALSDVCESANPFSLTGGLPAGGSYSGSGVQSNSFDPAQAGIGTHTITYSFTDMNACTNTAETLIVVNSCLGLNSIENSQYLIYPNPVSEQLVIECKCEVSNAEIRVYDATGRLILSTKLEEDPTTIDVRSWTPGTYSIVIQNETDEFESKVIVQ